MNKQERDEATEHLRPLASELRFAQSVPTGLVHVVPIDVHGREGARALCGFVPRHGWFHAAATLAGMGWHTARPSNRCGPCVHRSARSGLSWGRAS